MTTYRKKNAQESLTSRLDRLDSNLDYIYKLLTESATKESNDEPINIDEAIKSVVTQSYITKLYRDK